MIQQWEYNCIDVPEQFPGLELARLGLEGWELVNVRLEQIRRPWPHRGYFYRSWYFFKRPLENVAQTTAGSTATSA